MQTSDKAKAVPASARNRGDTAEAESADPVREAVPAPIGGLSTGPAVRRAVGEAVGADPLGGTAIPQSVLGALRRNQGSGQPLPGDLSASAGEALGRDFSPVRVHTDPEAATLARSVQAVAFTHGHDIYFSAGSYRPTESEGQRLIAHELGHIGQPDSGTGGTIGRADDPAEAAADRAADGVLAALRRQAVRGASTADTASPESGSAGSSTHSEHPGCPNPPELRRLPRPAQPIRRMKVNKDGTYAVFSGHRDTADRQAFARWVEELLTKGDVATLTTLRTALHRTVFEPADHETLAMSLVQRALDKLAPGAPAPGDGAQPNLRNLPRDEWWKLFIEGDKHDLSKTDDQNAMRFDSDQSPGYYAAMSRAFETFVAQSDGHELGFADYDAMHLAVTQDTLSKDDDNTFHQVPHKLSANNIQFPMTHGEFPNAEALMELRAEGMLGLDAKGMQVINTFAPNPVRDERVRELNENVTQLHEQGSTVPTTGAAGTTLLLSLREIYQGQGPLTNFSSTLQVVKVTTDNSLQLLVNTNREKSAADGEVTALFRHYYNQLTMIDGSGSPDVQKRRAKLGQIARLVRALHVGHYFHDANGRLNTMVLLNRLLVDCGFSPVLMNRTDIFGGAYSEKELVAAIEVGFAAFAAQVRLAHTNFDDLVDLPDIVDLSGGLGLGNLGLESSDDSSDSKKEELVSS